MNKEALKAEVLAYGQAAATGNKLLFDRQASWLNTLFDKLVDELPTKDESETTTSALAGDASLHEANGHSSGTDKHDDERSDDRDGSARLVPKGSRLL